jgi:hypothetical protein
MQQCHECGFEYELDEAAAAGPNIVRGVAELVGILDADTECLKIRREPGTWSALEYGCHVRDVLLVQRERVLAAQIVDRPSFNPMGRDERVLSRLDLSDWDLSVMYNYPERTERSLRWVAVHTMHEVRHHLLDARRQLD